jgi:hypothetical protein
MPITTYPLSSGGASTFLQLTDTFASYSGEGGKGVRVNAGATALEPYTISSGGDVSAASNFGTDNLLIRSDGTLKGVQGSGISVNDSDDVSGVNSLVGKSTGLEINTISNGDITIEPHGSGLLNVIGGSGEVNVTTASGNADINITPHGAGKSIIKNPQISNLTANELIGTDANKNLESLAVATYPSKTELTYVKGVTSAIQTQFGDKQNILSEGAFVNGDKTKLDGIEPLADVTDLTNVLASLNTITDVAEGDILYRNDTGWVRLARGTDNQVLTATATTINWENASSGFADPMTTEGDIIYRTSGGVTTRLGKGTDGQVLTATADSINWENASGGGHTRDATLTQATSAFDIDGKDVRITLSTGTSGSLNTFIDMATVNYEGNRVEILNSSGDNYTITTTSLSNFIGGSYVIPDGAQAVFYLTRNLLTTTFDQDTHIYVGNAGAYS